MNNRVKDDSGVLPFRKTPEQKEIQRAANKKPRRLIEQVKPGPVKQLTPAQIKELYGE